MDAPGTSNPIIACLSRALPAACLAALLHISPVQAQQSGAQQSGSQQGSSGDQNDDGDKQKQYREQSTVEDVAMSPLRDTNIKARDIPPELEKILDHPYAPLPSMRCAPIRKAVEELDTVLGPDLDARGEADTLWKKREKAAGRLAKSFVGGFIPFRGLIREVSGASDADRKYRAAIDAGLTRRAYLKGYGAARRCKPPAAPLPHTAASPGANVPDSDDSKNDRK